MKFSANLGFLWTELPLPDAICAAKRAGFDAVECHWPYETDPVAVNEALAATGLSMIGLNTRPGSPGENGLSALPGRESEAQQAIDEAITYAANIKASNVHVMAGNTSGGAAHNTFISNLRYACRSAIEHDIQILIEPLNPGDAPGYFLNRLTGAKAIIEEVDLPNLKLMFDCYHVELIEGDTGKWLRELMSIIGHIQFASVPDRGPPGEGDLNYERIFELLHDLGYNKPIGAEYRPTSTTEESLGWMKIYNNLQTGDA